MPSLRDIEEDCDSGLEERGECYDLGGAGIRGLMMSRSTGSRGGGGGGRVRRGKARGSRGVASAAVPEVLDAAGVSQLVRRLGPTLVRGSGCWFGHQVLVLSGFLPGSPMRN